MAFIVPYYFTMMKLLTESWLPKSTTVQILTLLTLHIT